MAARLPSGLLAETGSGCPRGFWIDIGAEVGCERPVELRSDGLGSRG